VDADGRRWVPQGGDVADGGRDPLPSGRVDSAPEPLVPDPLIQGQGDALGAGDEGHDTSGAPGHLIRGHVLDARAELPVTRFRVTLVPRLPPPNVADPVGYAFEDPRGRFQIDDPPVGPHQVHVSAEGYASWHVELDLGAQDERVLIAPLEGGASISGRLTDGRTGMGLPGVVVLSEADVPATTLAVDLGPAAAEAAGLNVAITDADGRFVLRDLTAGEHVLRASRDGWTPAWSRTVQVDPAEGGEQRVEEVDWSLDAGAQVEGRVLRDDGTPWADATIISSHFRSLDRIPDLITFGSAVTDADGRYAMDDLPPGHNVVLNVEFDEPRAAQEGALDDPGWRMGHMAFLNLERRTTSRVDFPLSGDAGSSRIEGRVVDAEGRPRDDLMLMLARADAPMPWDEQQLTARPDAEGRFRFDGLGAGSYLLLGNPGQAMDNVLLATLEVPVGVERVPLDLTLAAGAFDVRITAGGEVVPFAAVLVLRVREAGDTDFVARVISDHSGLAHVPFIGPGTYRLVALALSEELAPASVTPLVHDGAGTQPVALELPPGAPLDVVLTDTEGRPVAGAHLETIDSEGRSMRFEESSVTGADGRHRTPHLWAGEWLIRAHKGGVTVSGRVLIQLGQANELSLVLEGLER